MTRRKRIRTAAAVTFERCDCGCGLSFIVLHGEDEEPYACAGMETDEWPKFIAEAIHETTAKDQPRALYH